MPIYAYKCGSCGHAKDVLQKISDAPLRTCPACGADAFSKQLTAAGFQLKGSGWYVTDFRNNNTTTSATGGGAAKTGGSADEAAKPSSDSDSTSKPADSAPATPKSDGPAASAGGCGGPCACH